MKSKRLAIDIGGTFTDLVLFDERANQYSTKKVLSTPKNPALGVLEGMRQLIERLEELDYFVHGTTAGLNAFLERKGAKVALIVTAGFRDIYEIARANRPDMYSIQYRKPVPLVKRRHVFEIRERILADGSIEQPLDESEVEQLIDQIVAQGYQSIVTCFLHSYRNPQHEIRLRELFAAKVPQISITVSHEIAREWREYERTSTAVINGYIAPIVENYLTTLENETAKEGLESDIFIMQSNGGVMTSNFAKRHPLQTLLSGPVGGAIGGIRLASETDQQNLICVDMGGTSFDVSLIIDGKPDVTSETQLEGFPILSPMVNIHTIGAGGGSIAWLEAGGLRVGPKSAGADPGPACYCRGGEYATVTDANLVLGRIDANGFLGGDMQLDKEAAYQAVKKIADQLQLDVLETAEGICNIANAKMADAIRTLTVRKGIDPRNFSLVAFGGAGPMHAVLIAELLEIHKVIVPSVAGLFSAWGMLQTDIRHDSVRTFYETATSADPKIIQSLYEEMEQEISENLQAQRIEKEQMTFFRTADFRYVGQEYTVNVPNQSDAEGVDSISELIARFHDLHLQIYGHNNQEGAVEFVNLRVIGYGNLKKPLTEKNTRNSRVEPIAEPPQARLIKPVVFNERSVETPIYKTDMLQPGHSFMGPAVIEDKSSTTVVPEGYTVLVDSFGNLEITRSEQTW